VPVPRTSEELGFVYDSNIENSRVGVFYLPSYGLSERNICRLRRECAEYVGCAPQRSKID
jgi:hypothetical protein